MHVRIDRDSTIKIPLCYSYTSTLAMVPVLDASLVVSTDNSCSGLSVENSPLLLAVARGPGRGLHQCFRILDPYTIAFPKP